MLQRGTKVRKRSKTVSSQCFLRETQFVSNMIETICTVHLPHPFPPILGHKMGPQLRGHFHLTAGEGKYSAVG